MTDGETPWRATPTGLAVRVRLTPKGGRDALDGIERLSDDSRVLKARVRAAPENGEANAALEHLLAKTCGIARSRASVTSGPTSRIKTVSLYGDAETLAAALATALSHGVTT